MASTPIPRKKTIATETDTEEKHANGARGKSLRKSHIFIGMETSKRSIDES